MTASQKLALAAAACGVQVPGPHRPAPLAHPAPRAGDGNPIPRHLLR